METIYDPQHYGPCVLVLGTFDGVHLGHRQLLMTGRAIADELDLPLCAMTFDPHPTTVFSSKPSVLLTTVAERALLMAACKVDALCVRTFTREYAATSPEDFLAMLKRVYEPAAIVCGFNYTFGSKGRGDCEMLQCWGNANNCRIAIVPEFRMEGDTVSSTRIRRLLSEGDLSLATELLGHPYNLTGEVVSGKHLGHTLGFPTANIAVPTEKALPAFGVYAGLLYSDGKAYASVVNIGRQPTAPSGSITVEAFLLDAEIDLYGKTVRLELLHFQRPEKRFADLTALQAQIRSDAENARQLLAHSIT